MRSRLGVGAVLATALAATLGLGTLSPAYAAPAAPVISDLVASVPGQVSGTVTVKVDEGAEAFVFVGITGEGLDTSVTPLTVIPDADPENPDLTGDTYTGTFTLETWGRDAGSTVSAVSCTSANPSPNPNDEDCSQAAASDAFTPTDITPDVTADLTVGPAPQDATITASGPGEDPIGAGPLYAVYDNAAAVPTKTVLVEDVPLVLDLADAATTVVSVVRCSTTDATVCSDAGFVPSPLTRAIDVRRTMDATVDTAPDAVTPVDPNTSFVVSTPRAGSYSVDWHLEPVGSDVPVPGYSGTDIEGSLTGGDTASIPVDATAITNGSYQVVGSITVTDPQYGSYTDAFTSPAFVATTDVTGPAVNAISRSVGTVYPKIGTVKRPDEVKFRVDPVSEDAVKIRITTAGGNIARELATAPDETAVWNGRNGSGVVVPAGTYTIRALDPFGNPSTVSTTVVVDTRVLVTKKFTKTVTPAASDIAKYVGRCSQLKVPSNRGWGGSFGYYANTKCGTLDFAASGVSTVHKTSLPSADAYLDVHVNVYGGAAKAVPVSAAALRYLSKPLPTNDGGFATKWLNETVISKSMGLHIGPTTTMTKLIQPKDGSFRWGIATSAYNRYDVKYFTVVIHYKTLG